MLDVVCGTGIVARTVADLIGSDSVVGVDLNEAMLTVARRVRPEIDWRQGDAAALPFPDGSFDAVLCQMALMFFPDPSQAVREMGRVVTGGGPVGVLVPADLAEQPAYGPLVDMAARHVGPEAWSLLTTYFACGDLDRLAGLFGEAGLRVATTRTEHGKLRYPSVEAAMDTEVNSTPLGERITPDVYDRILAGAREPRLFTASDGTARGALHELPRHRPTAMTGSIARVSCSLRSAGVTQNHSGPGDDFVEHSGGRRDGVIRREVCPNRSGVGGDRGLDGGGQVTPGGRQPSAIEEPVAGQFVDEIGRVGEVGPVGDCARQAHGIDAALENIGQSQGHPVSLRENGPRQQSAKQGVEGLLGLADELRAERCRHRCLR